MCDLCVSEWSKRRKYFLFPTLHHYSHMWKIRLLISKQQSSKFCIFAHNCTSSKTVGCFTHWSYKHIAFVSKVYIYIYIYIYIYTYNCTVAMGNMVLITMECYLSQSLVNHIPIYKVLPYFVICWIMMSYILTYPDRRIPATPSTNSPFPHDWVRGVWGMRLFHEVSYLWPPLFFIQ